MMPPVLLTTALLLGMWPTTAPFALNEARAMARPGRGRHRRAALRARHAARGGAQ